MKIITLAIIASATLAASAQASDNTANFVGPRAEAMIGYEHISEPFLPTKADGVGLAGAMGYDIRIANNLTAGVDLELGVSNTKQDLGGGSTVETGKSAYIGGRLGFTANPTTQLYIKGGYANSEVQFVNSGIIFATGELDGARIGAGVEKLISDTVFLKGEYRYTNSENAVQSHQAMVGAGVRF